jgi:hypothetical protein
MLKILTPRQLHAFYQSQAAELLPQISYNKMVPIAEQEEELRHLKETVHYERFFFIMNLHKMQIEFPNGIERWLGYNERDFSLLRYLEIIHPSHTAAHYITSVKLIEGLMRGDWNIEFMKHRYITNIALKHKKGHYLLCKRLACIFQYDEKRRLLEYINEFTIVGEYADEPYSVRATSDEGENLKWLNELLARTQKAFEEKNLFGFQEMRILRKYAYNDEISIAQVANAFKIQESTVITYNKRILEKAESLLSKRFANAKQVAYVLKEQGLV